MDNHKQNWLIMPKIVVRTVRDFVRTKSSLRWRIKSVAAKCRALPPKPARKAGEGKISLKILEIKQTLKDTKLGVLN